MATRYDRFFFKDESLVFELIRVMAKTLEHGADIGESLSTAFRIKQKVHFAPLRVTVLIFK